MSREKPSLLGTAQLSATSDAGFVVQMPVKVATTSDSIVLRLASQTDISIRFDGVGAHLSVSPSGKGIAGEFAISPTMQTPLPLCDMHDAVCKANRLAKRAKAAALNAANVLTEHKHRTIADIIRPACARLIGLIAQVEHEAKMVDGTLKHILDEETVIVPERRDALAEDIQNTLRSLEQLASEVRRTTEPTEVVAAA